MTDNMRLYDLESLQPVAHVPGELARAGQSPSLGELQQMLPDLRARDYEAILWQLRRITTPSNRHERRATAVVRGRARRATERALELSLSVYETITATFTEAEKKAYARALKEKHPHPEGRFAATALDPKLTELRRSLWEVAVAFRMHNRKARAMRRIQSKVAGMAARPAESLVEDFGQGGK